MTENDCFFWKLVTILGINIAGYRLKPYEKYLSIVILIFGHFFIVHWILASLKEIILHGDTSMAGLVYSFIPVQVVIICYFLNTQKKLIGVIIQKLYNYRKHYKKYNNRLPFLEAILIFFILLPCIISVVSLYLKKNFEDRLVWSFQYKIHGEIAIRVFSFYTNFGYFSVTIFIALIVLTLSMLFYRWGEVLDSYNYLLNLYFQHGKLRKRVTFLKQFFDIIKILQDLDEALSCPSFIIVFYDLEIIFLMLYLYLLENDKLYYALYVFDLFFNGILGIFILLAYTISSSMIPQKIMHIKRTARHIITMYGDCPLFSRSVLFYLERIEKEEIVYMSAGGMFTFTRQFILSAIGVILTYDLLIINYK